MCSSYPPTRRELYQVLQDKEDIRKSDCQHLLDHIISRWNIPVSDDNFNDRLTKALSRFISEVNKRWQETARVRERFLKKNEAWLDLKLSLPDYQDEQPGSSCAAPGRPPKSFEECTDRNKRRKIALLRNMAGSDELSFAAEMSLRSSGKEDAAKLVHEVTLTTPTRSSKIRKAWKDTKCIKPPIPFTEDEALSLFIEGDLSTRQYQLFRSEAKAKNADVYPSLTRLQEAKRRCYPNKNAITVTETAAEIQLQDLLNHTAERLVMLQESVIQSIPIDVNINLCLISKWGCDGSSGQATYKQTFADCEANDTDIFVTSLVPVQLYLNTPSESRTVIWQNPRPSSTRFCRPIRVQFQKETAEKTVEEHNYIQGQIDSLEPTKIAMSFGKLVIVNHNLMLTMIDGKVCSALSGTSTQTCFICGAKPSEMNHLDRIFEKSPDITMYSFGLSTLHAYIRFLEFFLHVAYRLDMKKWQMRTSDDKYKFSKRKRDIQSQFKREMGLVVDVPKPGGSGTTNDGNTARRFFSNPATSAEITGVERALIERSGVILRAMSSGFEIDVVAFHEYCLETARRIISAYPWYNMPVTVHKVLIHGSAVISAALLPIGQLSEEAQEARNKDIKKYRENFTRKYSRVATNIDLLHRLLLSSDPVISSLRRLPKKKQSKLPHEVAQLLKEPSVPQTDTNESSIGVSLDLSECESDFDSE